MTGDRAILYGFSTINPESELGVFTTFIFDKIYYICKFSKI